MPLKPGRNQAIVNANIRELMKSGMPRKQAIAVSLKTSNKKSDDEKAVKKALA